MAPLNSGIFLGFCANVIVKDTGDISWRLQLGSAFIPAFILMLGIWFTPESPRWLMKHGKFEKGFQSFLKLRAHPIISARDYYYSYVIYKEEEALTGGGNYFSRMRDIFTIPRIRRANYGASTVMLAQQMCGINSESGQSTVADPSHLLLLLLHLCQGWLLRCRSAVRVARIRCGPGDLHHPDSVSSPGDNWRRPELTIRFMIDTVGRRRLCLIASSASAYYRITPLTGRHSP
jgi:MFS family permease